MIYRIDVATIPPARNGPAATDPLGEAIRHQIAEFGTTVGPIHTARIFLIDTDASVEQVRHIARQLLADPIVEQADVILQPPNDAGRSRIEIHLKPGVMDPVAASTEMAIRDMGLLIREVRTGRAYLIEGAVDRQQLQYIAARVLANGVIESVHFDAFIPREFPRGHDYAFRLIHVPLRNLTDEQLVRFSREKHLFLSLAEMKAIQNYYRQQNREPNDIELETLAQTWSEHCVHKTLKIAVDVEVQDEAGNVLSRRHYDNLIKDTIFKSTMELMGRATEASSHEGTKGEFCLSVFADNAGVIVFDDTDAVCFKVETHNHPSAIEPYGGSATGIGGVIRDVLGTGLAAKPIANTDIFCVADPNFARPDALLAALPTANRQPPTLPKGVIHPKRILQQVVAGVRDYGNRMGIPTVNGAVYFDNRYLGNPLVFCGCVGLIPRRHIHKAAKPGDAIVVMGGRTGRDGIHGATFSSAELTDTHADEFSHAVQIGNAITEKKVTDVILQARDRGLFTAITDCGAGGLSSAVGEMGEKVGAAIELHKVPLKYAGLRYDEIWISEAQERMVLSVPPHHVQALLDLAQSEDVEATVIGHFGTDDRQLILHYQNQEVARLSMQFLHDGIPMPTRKAVLTKRQDAAAPAITNRKSKIENILDLPPHLLRTLAHPNIASKHWIIRQYDHEVQGGSAIKPLVGKHQIGPSDAAVLRPKLGSYRGIAIACGLAPHIQDPYDMAIAAIDEAIRNVIAVGADPAKIAILDNFCWPSVDDERTMGTLVAACEACYDAAKTYGIPFISGKDSLHNQFTNQETGEVIRIPNTLLISAIAVLDDVRKCVTMDLKTPGNPLCLIRPRGALTLASSAALHRTLAAEIRRGTIRACHDVSDGGPLVAAAEMCIASGLGLDLDCQLLIEQCAPFDELPAHYLVEFDAAANIALDADVILFGRVHTRPELTNTATNTSNSWRVPIPELIRAWRGTLDW